MFLFALICALIAAACFVWSAWPHPTRTPAPVHPVSWLSVGLVFLTAAWVSQIVITTGWRWTIT